MTHVSGTGKARNHSWNLPFFQFHLWSTGTNRWQAPLGRTLTHRLALGAHVYQRRIFGGRWLSVAVVGWPVLATEHIRFKNELMRALPLLFLGNLRISEMT